MTDSGPPEEALDSSESLLTEGSVVPVAADDAIEPARPGLRTFSLEHRVAPGLYLLGWLACLVGLGLLVVAVLSEASLVRSSLLVLALLGLGLGLVAGAGQQALERHARASTGYAGPSPFLLFAAVVPISLLLTLLAAVILSVLGLGFESAAGIVAGSLATAIPFVALVWMLVVGTGSLTVADLGFGRWSPQTARGVSAGVLWGIALVFGTSVLALILAPFLPIPPGPLPVATTMSERLAVLLVAAVVAPLSEEIFFRGFATTAWARSMPRGAAILRSGLFFAFIHVLTISGATTFEEGLGFAAFAFLTRLPVSIALAAVFLRRGSIYESLALHSTFNAVPLLLVILASP